MMKVYGGKNRFFPEMHTKTDIGPLKTIFDPSYIQRFSPYCVVDKQILDNEIQLLKFYWVLIILSTEIHDKTHK